MTLCYGALEIVGAIIIIILLLLYDIMYRILCLFASCPQRHHAMGQSSCIAVVLWSCLWVY